MGADGFKLTELNAPSRIGHDGLLYLVEDPASLPVGRKMTVEALRRLVDVRDHAAGDGVTDDTAAVAEAYAAAAVLGGVARFSQGSYLVTAVSAPANVATVFCEGALLVKSASCAPVFAGEFSAGNHQVFSGFDSGDFSSSTFAAGKVDEINAAWFGASPSADPGDNTTALNAWAAALHSGCRARLPNGTYETDDVVAIANLDHAKIFFDGMILNDESGTNGLSFNQLGNCRVMGIKVYRSTPLWTGSDCGVLIQGTIADCLMDFRYVSGFVYARKYYAPYNKGIGYCEFRIGQSELNKYHDYLLSDRSAGGISWIGNSRWSGGGYHNSGLAGADDWAVYIDNTLTGRYHHLTFRDGTYELLGNGLKLSAMYHVLLDQVYFEGILNTHLDVTSCLNLTWVGLYGDTAYEDLTILRDSGTRGLAFLGAYKYAGTEKSLLMSAMGGGISFDETYDLRGGASARSRLSAPDLYQSMAFVSLDGVTQRFDKQFTCNGAAPTSGTYSAGAWAWNLNTAAGQAVGYACTVYGTAGTLSGVTADTTSGSNIITVNDATDLRYGQVVNVAGSSSMTSRYITGIDGNDVTLSGAAAAATTSGEAVSWKTPTFKAGSTYA